MISAVFMIQLMIIQTFGAGSLSIKVSDIEAEPGESISIPVVITDNPGFAFISCSLKYDEDKLEFESVTETGITDWTIKEKAVWVAADDTYLKGEILSLNFKVKNTAEGIAAVSLENVEVYNSEEEAVAVSLLAGNITINETGSAPAVTNGIAIVDGEWVLLKDGSIAEDTTTVVQGTIDEENAWWYVKDGKVKFDYDGFADNEYGRWRIEKGKVNFSYNDIVYESSQWRYYYGGLFQKSYTGVTDCGNASGWWYVKNGVVDFTANTVAANKNGWWKVTNGRVDFSFTGIAENSYGRWYIENGRVNFSLTGTKVINGRAYKIAGGKVS